MPEVLVTGGTGFIAGYCIKQLLEQGYKVVTTVRTEDKGNKVLDGHAAYSNGRLSYQIVEDVGRPGAFDEVIKSNPKLDYVLHTASPFHYNVQDPVKDFLEPALIGTTSILKAVKNSAPAVKRVVITSSFAAMRNFAQESDTHPPTYNESCWNLVTWDEAVNDVNKTYQGSKSLAERAAWEFVETHRPNFDLVAINPCLIFGPAAPHLTPTDELSESLNASNLRILDIIQGKAYGSLDSTNLFSFVDVRDVAMAHVRALQRPDAGGKRFFVIERQCSNRTVVQIIAGMEAKYRTRLPDLKNEQDHVTEVRPTFRFDNTQSRNVLGLEYMSLERSVTDTVESLVRLGALNPSTGDGEVR